MSRKRENKEDMLTEDSSVNEETPTNEESKVVEFIALQTMKVYCNKSFSLIEGQKIPKDFPKEFITSLINSKIIKEV